MRSEQTSYFAANPIWLANGKLQSLNIKNRNKFIRQYKTVLAINKFKK